MEVYVYFFVKFFTHLLIQFEKHMVDFECRLHFVPSMIKFRNPERKKKKRWKKRWEQEKNGKVVNVIC